MLAFGPALHLILFLGQQLENVNILSLPGAHPNMAEAFAMEYFYHIF